MAMNAGTIFAELKAKTGQFVGSMKAAGDSVVDLKKESKSLNQLMKQGLGFVGVIGTVAALRSEFSKSVQAASQYESAMMGLTSVSNAFGVSQEEANQAALELSQDGLLSYKGAAEGLKNLLPRFNGDMEDAVTVMNTFKDAAAFSRQGTLSYEEAIVGATGGLKNLNSIMVDNVGISKNISLILKESGFTMQDLDDATKSEAATQALLNGIMKEGALFTGDAERAANSYQGRLAQLETATFNLRREIGAQLLPVLSTFIDDGVNAANSATKAASGTQKFGEAVFVVGNILKGSFFAVKTMTESVTALGQMFVGLQKVVTRFALSFAENITNASHMLKAFATAGTKALSGDLKGAAASLADDIFGKPLHSAIGEASLQLDTFTNLSDTATNSFREMTSAFAGAFKLEGFEQLSNEDFSLDPLTRSGGEASSAVEKAKKALEEAGDETEKNTAITRLLAETFRDLGSKVESAFDKFKSKRRDVRDAMDAMKDGVKALKKEIAGIQETSKETVKGLISDFKSGMAELTSGLGANIGKEVIALEGSIAEAKDKIRELREGVDTTDLEEDAADEIKKIRNSLNDFATAAEKAEATERIAAIEAERDEKIAEKKAEVEEAVALLQKQVDQEQAILNQHKDTFKEFADSIAEERRKSSEDSITLLLEQFEKERDLRAEKTFDEIQAEEQARLESVQAAKEGFAEEFGVREKNLENLEEFWKKKEKKFEKHLKRLRKKQKKVVDKIEEEFTEALAAINVAAGGQLEVATGGDLGVEAGQKRNGGVTLQIDNFNVASDVDANAVIDRLTNLLDTATA